MPMRTSNTTPIIQHRQQTNNGKTFTMDIAEKSYSIEGEREIPRPRWIDCRQTPSQLIVFKCPADLLLCHVHQQIEITTTNYPTVPRKKIRQAVTYVNKCSFLSQYSVFYRRLKQIGKCEQVFPG